jgi:hypothetical protein
MYALRRWLVALNCVAAAVALLHAVLFLPNTWRGDVSRTALLNTNPVSSINSSSVWDLSDYDRRHGLIEEGTS